MARIDLAEQSAPSTPSSGVGSLYIDSTTSVPAFINDGGRKGLAGGQGAGFNASIASQNIAAADTYLTDSDLLIPGFGMQAKSCFMWELSLTKTDAASTATPSYNIRIGANRTTADTARLTLTGPAQTAATDAGVIRIIVVVRSVSASGVIQGTIYMDHNLAATGLANNASSVVEGTSAAFDNTALGGQYIGLSINNGASAAWTVTQVRALALW